MDNVKIILSGIFAIYLILINMVAFYMYGVDKRNARAGRNRAKGNSARKRIPERVLLTVAALGGAAGSLIGMRVYRHKTKKSKFYITIPVLLVMQCILLMFIIAGL
ncbi:MAG: DUF1294 domain-containing protein [Coprococcus sp.]